MSFLFEELSREECEAIREQDGYKRGLEEGRREEREKSRQQQLATAARLKEMGLSPEKIAEATGLALDEARKL